MKYLFFLLILPLHLQADDSILLEPSIWSTSYYDSGIQTSEGIIGYQFLVHIQNDRLTLLVDSKKCQYQLIDKIITKGCHQTTDSHNVEVGLHFLNSYSTPKQNIYLYEFTDPVSKATYILKILKRTFDTSGEYAASMFYKDKDNKLVYIGLQKVN
ncbi:MAG: hypothetical protein KDD37_00470 [Bdellovibrionales bacterium]|nr:hypothetical protein [Bdellovibrionales bacterium]